jgi:ribonuclease M5
MLEKFLVSNKMKRIKEVIIVEGAHDVAHLKSFIDADIITTNGTSLSQDFWSLLRAYENAGREFIILTDPDSSGAYIRGEILKVVPNAKHGFVSARESKFKNKVGIEHASQIEILKVLSEPISFDKGKQKINSNDLFELGLTANLKAKARRDYITNKLRIGPCNSKTFLYRVSGLNLTKDDLKKLLEDFKDE